MITMMITAAGRIGRKAQSDIISAVIIVVITIGLVGTAYTWGLPLLQKQQSRAVAERVYSYFDRTGQGVSLPELIEEVANSGVEGTERTFSSSDDGIWKLDESANYIEFTISAQTSNIATGIGWICLTGGATCPPSAGIVGENAGVVCGRADASGTGYNITYRLWYRELDDASGTKANSIDLVKHSSGPSSSTGRDVRIMRGSVTTSNQAGKTLKTTEVKILLS